MVFKIVVIFTLDKKKQIYGLIKKNYGLRKTQAYI